MLFPSIVLILLAIRQSSPSRSDIAQRRSQQTPRRCSFLPPRCSLHSAPGADDRHGGSDAHPCARSIGSLSIGRLERWKGRKQKNMRKQEKTWEVQENTILIYTPSSCHFHFTDWTYCTLTAPSHQCIDATARSIHSDDLTKQRHRTTANLHTLASQKEGGAPWVELQRKKENVVGLFSLFTLLAIIGLLMVCYVMDFYVFFRAIEESPSLGQLHCRVKSSWVTLWILWILRIYRKYLLHFITMFLSQVF